MSYFGHETVVPVMSAKNSGPEEIAMGVRENERGVELPQRVNEFEFIVWDGGRVNMELNREQMLGEMEYQGMVAMADLFRGGCEWVEWISPPGGISNYPGTRICLLKGSTIEGGFKFKGWGICSLHSGDDCLKIAREQMKTGAEVPGLVFCFDDLRKTPLGFKCNDEQILTIMRQTIDLPEVWRAIEEGVAEKDQRQTVIMVEEILDNLRPEERIKMSDYQFQYWFELQLAQRGRFLGQGAHGGSVLGGGGYGGGAFNQVWGMVSVIDRVDGRLERCPSCHNFYMKKKGKCPKCSAGQEG